MNDTKRWAQKWGEGCGEGQRIKSMRNDLAKDVGLAADEPSDVYFHAMFLLPNRHHHHPIGFVCSVKHTLSTRLSYPITVYHHHLVQI